MWMAQECQGTGAACDNQDDVAFILATMKASSCGPTEGSTLPHDDVLKDEWKPAGSNVSASSSPHLDNVSNAGASDGGEKEFKEPALAIAPDRSGFADWILPGAPHKSRLRRSAHGKCAVVSFASSMVDDLTEGSATDQVAMLANGPVAHAQRLEMLKKIPQKGSSSKRHWRKYGQKLLRRQSCSSVKVSRMYYKCNDPSCPVRRQVEVECRSGTAFTTNTTDIGIHTCGNNESTETSELGVIGENAAPGIQGIADVLGLGLMGSDTLVGEAIRSRRQSAFVPLLPPKKPLEAERLAFSERIKKQNFSNRIAKPTPRLDNPNMVLPPTPGLIYKKKLIDINSQPLKNVGFPLVDSNALQMAWHQTWQNAQLKYNQATQAAMRTGQLA